MCCRGGGGKVATLGCRQLAVWGICSIMGKLEGVWNKGLETGQQPDDFLLAFFTIL